MKWYSRPSDSPARGGRVVAETETERCGSEARTSRMTVPFPAPDGPEMTKTDGMPTPRERR